MQTLQKIYLRRDIPRYEKQQYAHVLLHSRSEKLSKRTPESVFNLQPSTSSERDASIYSFLWVLRKFLGTFLLWKTSCELVLKGEFNEKWRTDIPILIMTALAKNRHCEVNWIYLRTIDRKVTMNLTVIFNSFTYISFLKHVTKIF